MELDRHTDYRALDQLIDSNIRFAIYRLPGKEEINFIFQKSSDPVILTNITNLNNQSGFIIAPFLISKDNPLIVIKPEVVKKGECQIFSFIESLSLTEDLSIRQKCNSSETDTLDGYKNKYGIFHNAVADGILQKIVLSRTFHKEIEDGFSPGQSFQKACNAYRSNFVFLCNTPESGTWFGCSPELLVSGQDDVWHTDALAGTQDVVAKDKEVIWDDKNIEEQQIVVQYMREQLLKAEIESVHSKPRTITSGNLIHLKSEFTFHLNKQTGVGDLLNILHPSPAVCGFPKDEALRFIMNNEGYDRAYYSGFVGCIDSDGSTNLFVNLRCMNITSKILTLYAGGGILPSSNVMAEWAETEHKLQTILSVIN